MDIEKIDINDRIHLLMFNNQYDITSTFLRFQEHYESPEFKGKIFTFEEFKEWYTEDGEFSYYTDWNGFNIPSHILQPFQNGDFNPLSDKEKQLLGLFEGRNSKFYIIGAHRGKDDLGGDVVTHEVAHGLFYTDEQYRGEVLEVLPEFDLEELKVQLLKDDGYHRDVLDDECHAHTLSPSNYSRPFVQKSLEARLRVIFNRAVKRNNVTYPGLT